MTCKLIVVGNLVKDPDMKYTQGGTAVANITLASERRVKKGDTWEKETEYTSCFCFGKVAETVSKFMAKGCKMYVEGEKITEIFEKNGEKKYFTKCRIDNFEFLTWPKNNNNNHNQEKLRQYDDSKHVEDGEIPF